MLQFVYRIKFVTRVFVASPQPFDQSAINRFNQSKIDQKFYTQNSTRKQSVRSNGHLERDGLRAITGSYHDFDQSIELKSQSSRKSVIRWTTQERCVVSTRHGHE